MFISSYFPRSVSLFCSFEKFLVARRFLLRFLIVVFFWFVVFQVAERDGGSRDSNGGRAYAKGTTTVSSSSLPALGIDDFKVSV